MILIKDGYLLDPRSGYEGMADVLIEKDRIFEINTGAISRGWRVTPYPQDFLLRRIAEKGARVIITSDSHSRDTILFGYEAAVEYETWMTAHQRGKIVFLEIGVGYNTPGIIKYNFWQQVYQNPEATYACLNMEDSRIPKEIADQSILISGDSDQIIRNLAL